MATWKFDIATHKGLTLYVHVKDADGKTNNGNVYETFNISNWADYSKAMTETDLGAASPEIGLYSFTGGSAYSTPAFAFVFEQEGVSPASSDTQVGLATITEVTAVTAPTSEPYTETNLKIQLTSIQTAINNALVSPRPDWSVGQVRMSQGSYLKMLFDQQAEIIKQLKSIPTEDISTHQDAIGPFGEDVTDYVGEEAF